MTPRAEPLKLLALASAWVLGTRLALDYGALLLPAAVARRMTLEEFLPLAQTVTLALGLGLAWALLAEPRAALGLRGAAARTVAVACLAAPVVWVLALASGIAIALPTLLAELRRGGEAVGRQNLGELGRAVSRASVVVVVAWTIVVAPISEEVLFRGAVWSALRRLTGPAASEAAEPASLPPELLQDGLAVRAGRALWRGLRDGGLATLGSAAIFAGMHLGVHGGAGIVRVVSAACLGLACGVARHASGGLAAPIALHLVYNLLSIAHSRGWLVTAAFPKVFGVPSLAGVIAGAALVALAVVALVGRPRRAGSGAADLAV